MDQSAERPLQRAIETISQSDPIIKLMQQVQLGRMKPTDAGLRAVTESWLAVYEKALATDGLTRSALRRIDPAPRLAILFDAGVLANDHRSVRALNDAFVQAMTRAVDD